LSVQEYAAIQQFPSGYVFEGPLSQQYKQIGNAVPVGLGRAIGLALCRLMRAEAPEGQLRLLETAEDGSSSEAVGPRSQDYVYSR
jgi:DNA (cytosine-5)-methyltransferase 1